MSSRGKLAEATVGFFRRVSAILDDDDDTEEVGEEFFANVFERIRTNELKLSRDKVVCCILEKLLRAAAPVYVCEFVSNTLEDLERYISDKYASHVIQTALAQCLRMSSSELCDLHGEEETSLVGAVGKINEVILGNLNGFAFDVYGSHVVCALIQVLSGVLVGDDVTRSRVSRKVAQKKTGGGQDKNAAGVGAEVAIQLLPDGFSEQLEAFCDAFVSMRDFSHCLTDVSASKVLQTLLYCTHKRAENRCKHLCRQVLTACKILSAPSEDGRPEDNSGGGAAITRLAEDAVASHGLECILKVAPAKVIQRMCQQCFSGHLLPLALHPSGNYVVQKLCDVLTTEAQLSLVAGELLPNIEDILAVSYFGVPVALILAAVRLECHQEGLLDAMVAAFHAADSADQCCRAFLALSTLESLNTPPDDSEKSSSKHAMNACPQGCQLVTALFGLSEPTALLNSFVSLSTAELVSLATEHTTGSRIFDAFLACPGASGKIKRKLVKKLKGEFVRLACHKLGSYVVDACYKNTKAKSRRDVGDELLAEEMTLRESFFGKHVIRNCDLDNYKMQKAAMKSRTLSKKRLFSDLHDGGEDEYGGPRKKKKVLS